MSRLSPVNADFLTVLAEYEAAPGLVAGLRSALAVTPGDVLSEEEYPIFGFYLRTSAEQLLGYFLTPGRFIRYEVAGGEALTVTVPLERVRRVVERAGARRLSVTIELDADAAHSVTETTSRTHPDHNSMDDDRTGTARAVTRHSCATYELHVEVPIEDPDTGGTEVELIQLAAFSRALRATLGL